MSATERVLRLREQSINAVPHISPERALLITEFYQKSPQFISEPIRRALAFKYLMENKAIYIGEDELIVGEKGNAPKATPTYPELCCHSLEDLDILNSREKISFKVDQETRRLYEEKIIPFWKNRSIRDMVFREMSEEWKAAYDVASSQNLWNRGLQGIPF
jgi:formate C-acetyltransferase